MILQLITYVTKNGLGNIAHIRPHLPKWQVSLPARHVTDCICDCYRLAKMVSLQVFHDRTFPHGVISGLSVWC